jgi:hypothetical protein
MKAFSPWLKKAEERKVEGMKKPTSLVEACEILGDAKVGSVNLSFGNQQTAFQNSVQA